MGKVVGILSMQKVLNYGSYLQAYALKQLLLKNGASSVYFIDIEEGRPLPGFHDSDSVSSSFKNKVKNAIKAGNLISKIKDFIFIRRVYKKIISSYPQLGIYDKCGRTYDLAVIGSDEVFNCCQTSTWGYTSQLYGCIPQAQEVISYAGSFGHTTLEQLKEHELVDEIGKTMLTMKAISVRDQNSYEIVEKITGTQPLLHVDPVLAYGYIDEISQISEDNIDEYLLVYSYHTRIKDKDEINNIIKYARSKRLKIYSIYCRYDWCDKAIVPETPIEVLTYFKKAKYVVTDTFHGTIFSIITKSNFCTILRNNNRQKLVSLLEHFNLENRFMNSGAFDKIFSNNINYQQVDHILQEDRIRTTEYLKKYL